MEVSKNVISPLVAVVTGALCLGVGFGGGVWYQGTQRVNNFRQGMGNFGANQQQGGQRIQNNQNGNWGNGQMGMRGGNLVSGEVTAKDEKSITVKMNDGSSKIVVVGESTKYTISSEASASEVEVGTKVAVFGEMTNDGTTTATSIEVNPSLRGQNQ